jgi:YVTN family beta-propeller protein
LFDRLEEKYGGEVFKDVDSIELGDDFVDVINSAVGSCDVLLALIGDEWLTVTDDQGRRRLDDPDDYVRVEIEAALTRDVRVIPILVDGATMPRAEELPPSLAKLVRRQALDLSPSRFDFDTGRLLKVLDKTLAAMRMPAERGESGPSARPADEARLAGPAHRLPTERVGIGEPPAPSPTSERALSGEPPAPPPPTTETPSAPRPRRGLLIAGGAAALVVAALAIAVVLGSGGDGGDGGGGDGDEGKPSSIRLDPNAGPDGMAIDGGVIWVTDQNKYVLWRVDIEKNKSLGTIPGTHLSNPDGVVARDGTVWVANGDSGSVARLEVSDDGTVTKEESFVIEPEGSKPESLAFGGPWVWVTTNTGDVARIDRESRESGDRIPVGENTVGILAAEDGIYVSDNGGNTVTKLDPTSGEQMWAKPVSVGEKPRGLTLAEGSIWVTNSEENTVSRIDASTGEVLRRRIRVGKNPRDVTSAGGFIWVANTTSRTVTKIDARTEQIVDTITVGKDPASIVAGAGSIWVSNSKSGTLSRIEP